MNFFGIGMGEIVVIIIVALIVIGPARIPGMARTIGRTINSVKKASGELTSQLNKELEAEEFRKWDSKSAAAEKLPQSPGNTPNNVLSGDSLKATERGKAEQV